MSVAKSKHATDARRASRCSPTPAATGLIMNPYRDTIPLSSTNPDGRRSEKPYDEPSSLDWAASVPTILLVGFSSGVLVVVVMHAAIQHWLGG